MKVSRLRQLLVAIAITVFIAGCSKTATEAPKKAEPSTTEAKGQPEARPKEAPKKASYMVGAASTGGTLYQWVGSLAKVVNDHSNKVELTAQVTAGSGENIQRLADKSLDLGAVSNDWVLKYYQGEGVPAFKDARAIFISYAAVMQLVVPKNSPIKSIHDLKGKRVCLGPKGGGTAEANDLILEALGIKESDMKVYRLTTDQGKEALLTGQIDARLTQGAKSSWIEELAVSRVGMKLISMSEEDIKKVVEASGGKLQRCTLEAGAYPGQDYEVVGPGRRYTLVARSDFPEGLAYDMAKCLHENYEEWLKIFPTARGSTLKATVEEGVIPLHPGVEKLAKEVGLIK